MISECKKSQFADQKAAEFYIKKLKKTSVRSVIPLSSYLCPKCFQWHLTSNLKPIEKMSIEELKRENGKLSTTIGELRKELKELKSKA